MWKFFPVNDLSELDLEKFASSRDERTLERLGFYRVGSLTLLGQQQKQNFTFLMTGFMDVVYDRFTSQILPPKGGVFFNLK